MILSAVFVIPFSNLSCRAQSRHLSKSDCNRRQNKFRDSSTEPVLSEVETARNDSRIIEP
jgi:hypothetical protein